MTRVDFYVLDGGDATAHQRMICRVVEKAWRNGHRIYVRCPDDAASRAFDDLLWRFRDTSFVPHAIDDPDAPVVIGTEAAAAKEPDVLVNLTTEVPGEASRFERVIESAGYDEVSRSAARSRYRFYQDRGFPLHTHKIGN